MPSSLRSLFHFENDDHNCKDNDNDNNSKINNNDNYNNYNNNYNEKVRVSLASTLQKMQVVNKNDKKRIVLPSDNNSPLWTDYPRETELLSKYRSKFTLTKRKQDKQEQK